MHKYVTLIPARGGSKRLPGKNLKDLSGIPLIAHSFLYARKMIPESEIYVSTDDPEIAHVSRRFDVGVIDRPAELAHEYATTVSAIQHAVAELVSRGKSFDYVVVLQPTNPLRPDGMLEEAMAILDTGRYDSLFTVSPIVRKMGTISEGTFQPRNYTYGQRSQDMEPLYYENGLLYIARTALVLSGKLQGDTLFPLIVDHVYGTLDIDTEDDFSEVQYYMQIKNKNQE